MLVVRSALHCLSVISLLFLSTGQAVAQAPRAGHPAEGQPVQVVLLGVGHFAGSPADDFTSSIDDILESHRQAELAEVAGRLSAFEPQRIFLECLPAAEEALNDRYETYRTGAWNPTEERVRSEIHQLGFRVAARSGRSRVECVDAEGLWLGDQARQVGARHQPEVLEALAWAGRTSVERSQAFVSQHDLVQYLRWMNRDEELYRNHAQYLERYVRIGSFEGGELRLRMESELEGKQVVLAGEFEGFPVERVRAALASAGVDLADSLSPATDYLVSGQGAASVVEEARHAGVRVMDMQEFVAYALGRSELWVGFPDDHIGADLVGEWYKRNLRIFANTVHRVQPGTQRIFVMFGAGHLWTLRQFFDDHPGFELVEVDRLLEG
jgi:hypothetical protein